ncbi:MAG: phosphoribosyltransferase [Thermodesulfobacteriota bacterium]
MSTDFKENVIDLPDLRDRTFVFHDRAHAGKTVAGMISEYKETNARVLGIPAGGIPVAVEIADELKLSLDIAVVSKITLPWNTEAGYGAVAFDGTVRLNQQLVSGLGLSKKDIQQGIEHTSRKVAMRAKTLRGEQPFPDLSRASVLLVDDGLASGFTMLVGVEALRRVGVRGIVVAVPTGHDKSVRMIADSVEKVYCANIRHGMGFAVADAYERWSDVSDEEVMHLLQDRKGSG